MRAELQLGRPLGTLVEKSSAPGRARSTRTNAPSWWGGRAQAAVPPQEERRCQPVAPLRLLGAMGRGRGPARQRHRAVLRPYRTVSPVGHSGCGDRDLQRLPLSFERQQDERGVCSRGGGKKAPRVMPSFLVPESGPRVPSPFVQRGHVPASGQPSRPALCGIGSAHMQKSLTPDVAGARATWDHAKGEMESVDGEKTSSRSSLSQTPHSTILQPRFPASRPRSVRVYVTCQTLVNTLQPRFGST